MQSADSNRADHLFPMTHAQKRIWYGEFMHADTTLHLLSTILVFRGLIDQSKMVESIQQLVARHDALRMRLVLPEGDEEPTMGIFSLDSFPIETFDYRDASVEEWKEVLHQQEKQPISLTSRMLIRIIVLRVAENEARVMICAHHIIIDGLSLTILGDELQHLYLQSLGYAIPDLEPAPSFLEQVRSETTYMESPRFVKDRQYWQDQFMTMPPTSRLKPKLYGEDGLEAGNNHFAVGPELRNKLYEFSRDQGVSPSVLFMAILSIWFSRITGEDEVLLGTFSSNRTSRETKSIVGMLVSTTPFRISVDKSDPFLDFIQLVKRKQNEIFRHQKYPYNLVVPALRESFGISDQPLEVFMNYLPIEWQSPLPDGPVQYHVERGASWHQGNELTIFVDDYVHTEDMFIHFHYSASRFTNEEITRFNSHLISLMQSALTQPDLPLRQLTMISAEETNLILGEFNSKSEGEPPVVTVFERIEEHAKLRPDRIAIVHEDEAWSFGELNAQANRLARLLLEQGLEPEDRIGILMPRSIQMVASILGIWKAGGAYIPLDPDAPIERAIVILRDAGVKLLLIGAEQKSEELSELLTDITMLVQEEIDAELQSRSAENLNRVPSLDSLAYILFTSGSTGRPKGAMLEHKGMMNHVAAMAAELDMTESSVVAQNASHCFDVSVWQFFAGMCAGGQTVIYSSSLLQRSEEFLDRMVKDGITVLEVVPSYLAVLLEVLESRHRALSKLRYLIPTGEALKQDMLKRWFALYPDILVVNAYGPTEASDDITLHILRETPPQETIPIGRPLSGFRIYIVDEVGQLCPIGVKGEIWVSGIGVGRGYLNDPERTAAAFIDDPFSQEVQRLYKTGDLGRWMPDGLIEFFGRKDHQVKIRGFRIELGEIDSGVVNHPDVTQAVTIDLDDGTGARAMCVYYTAHRPLEVAEVKSFLEQRLPSYMVPSFYMQLDELPLTPNGKVDRRSLPQPDRMASLQQEYVPPRNETESLLIELWQEILGIERLGIRDNFFELGGHSLKAMTLLSRIHKLFHVEISLGELFRLLTIENLAPLVQSTGIKAHKPILPAPKQNYYPLSSGQKRLHVLQQFKGGALSYNMPAVLEAEGALDRSRLEEAVRALITRHEMLRTKFGFVDGNPIQQVQTEVDFSLAYFDIEETQGEGLEEIIRAFIRPFDLSQAPLMRVALIKRAFERHLVLFDMHHIISDGTSLAVLMEELAQLYAGMPLPQQQLHYKDFVFWQQQDMRSEAHSRLEAFWLEQFSKSVPVLDLPFDHPRPLLRDFVGGRVHFELDGQLTQEVKRLARLTDTTLFTLLLAAYGLLLAKLSGQDEIMVGTPVAGRNHADTANLIGMFVNTLPVRLHPEGGQSFAGYLRQVRQTVLGALEHQDYPFEELVERVAPLRDLSRNPLFDTMFILQNTEAPKLAWQDVHLTTYPFEFPIAKFDLTLTIIEQGNGLTCHLEYASALFAQDTAERWAAFYKELLQQIVKSPGRELHSISLMGEAELQKLNALFLSKRTPIETEQTLHGLFEQQAARTPERIALVCGGERITYAELNRKADRLAAKLRTKGVVRDEVVALLADRSVQLIVGLLAVNKAGAAYLPLDPDYPEERIRLMLDDSSCRVVLTQYTHLGKGTEGKVAVLLDREEKGQSEEIVGLDHSILGSRQSARPVHPNDLAYVIYTSGSTGKPKGVMIEHRSVQNLLLGMIEEIPLAEMNTVLSLTTVSFDIFVLETLLPLMLGSTVVLATKDEQLDAERLAKLCLQHRVELLQATPSRLRMLLGNRRMAEALASMRCVLVGGERLTEPLLQQLREVTQARLFNMYGPTETTVWSTVKEVTSDSRITIGSPILNTRVYIIDAYGELQPIGVPGELCIAGMGVARGYFNRQQLTAERFLPEPLIDAEDGSQAPRMYRTGDRACYLADGTIEYLGRLDDQVKIRGNRVEPGEIAAVLARNPRIRAIVVVDGSDERGHSYLAAYYESDEDLTAGELREYIRRRLPVYMVPSYFIRLESLPMTPNGKVNKAALPSPEVAIVPESRDTVPLNEGERILSTLWKDLLGLSEVGRHDNFFELGGHSLHAAQLVESIRKEREADLSLTDFFMYPTIASLANRLFGQPPAGDRVSAAEERAEGRKALMRKQRESRSNARA
ncbi:amino acid adenylation domain-containing protein [Paenibacillus sp. SI8]|uniref:amino acid adenylation domain-containing protein n=1 Tax=unclassified Paenibacillus TaxID=185978 RepID=UPI003466AA57